MVIPVSKVPDLEGQISMQPTGHLLHEGKTGSTSSHEIVGQFSSESDAGDANMSAFSASLSSMSSDSSRNSSGTLINNTKSMLFSDRSPRILMLYLYIVFGVFISFMIISSANFAVYTQNKNQVSIKI